MQATAVETLARSSRRLSAQPPLAEARLEALVARRPLWAVAEGIVVAPRAGWSRRTKRALDVVLSSVLLVLLAPLLVVLGMAVRLSSPGPAVFAQTRVGLKGRTFRFYKFRSMVSGAESLKAALQKQNEIHGPAFKLTVDPRITPLGAVLRKYSLDELPQLWNVLKGDMSLVGPRPPTPDEVEQYAPRHAQRLSVIPGITGLWQVSGRSEITDFERWVDLDLTYVERWSLWLDLRILVKTVWVVVRARGAR